MKWIVAYVVAGVSFGVLDALWLNWAGKNLYRPALGDLLAPSFRPAPAIVFYLLYVAALVWFAVRAGQASDFGGGIGVAMLNGALLGAICYATYDLTNQATMKVWPVHITLIDIAWGAFASAVAAGVGCWAASRWG